MGLLLPAKMTSRHCRPDPSERQMGLIRCCGDWVPEEIFLSLSLAANVMSFWEVVERPTAQEIQEMAKIQERGELISFCSLLVFFLSLYVMFENESELLGRLFSFLFFILSVSLIKGYFPGKDFVSFCKISLKLELADLGLMIRAL